MQSLGGGSFSTMSLRCPEWIPACWQSVFATGAYCSATSSLTRPPSQQPVFATQMNVISWPRVTCEKCAAQRGKSPTVVAFDCGMKNNIIRYLCTMGFELVVVPFDYNLKESDLEYDGIFISNGPGDPTMATATIDTLRWAMELEPPKPIFGICLGNQLLALASGAALSR